MGKISPKALQKHKRQILENELRSVLSAILRQNDWKLLLLLLTESEQVMLARRVQIAKRLIAGKRQMEIRQELGVGQATVEAVERWLRSHFGEYKQVLPSLYEEMREHQRMAKRKRPIELYTFRWLRRTYPLHFLLFNLILDDLDFEGNHAPVKKVKPQSYAAPTQEMARRGAEWEEDRV